MRATGSSGGWRRSPGSRASARAIALALLASACTSAPPPAPPPPEPAGPAWRRGAPDDDLAFALLQAATRRYWEGDLPAAAASLTRAQARAPDSAALALFQIQLRAERSAGEPLAEPDTEVVESILDRWPWHPLARRLARVPVAQAPPPAVSPLAPRVPDGDLERAIEQGRHGLEQAPGDPARLARQVVLLARADRLEEAQALLATAPGAGSRETAPDDPDAWIDLARGRLALWRGEPEAALRAFDAAAQRVPARVAPRLGRVDALHLAERPGEALAAADAALADHPDDPRVLRAVGDAAIAAGAWREAEAALRLAIDADPGDMASYHALARLWASQRLDDAGLARAERVFRAESESAAGHLVLGGIYELRNRLGDAAAHYERALVMAPELPAALNHMAWLLVARGDASSRALELARAAARARPADPTIDDTLGRILHERGHAPEAITTLHRAVAHSDPDMPERALVLHHLALAFDEAGALGDAWRASERALRALERDPDAVWGRSIRRHARALGGE